MRRISFFIYGIICYAIFFVTFLYAIAFVGNVVVPRTIDGDPQVPLSTALLVNLGLLTVFALQHSVMARKGFKRWWTRFVPATVERSTYVLASSVALILLFVFWEPMGGVIWKIEEPVTSGLLITLCAMGWATVLVSTFLINHFELFGLQQVWLHLRGREASSARFRMPILYKRVRHPIYLGFLVAFWATPTMTVTHLIFAIATTGYILVGIQLEERDLVSEFGETYVDYRNQVPMLVPVPGRKAAPVLPAASAERSA